MATLDKDIPIQRERGREGYASFLPLLVIAATCGVVLQSALQGIFSRWLKFDEAYSHGLLVLIISLYLVFRNLKAIWPLRLSPNILGFLALTSAAFVWA
ncbi:MAG TPA: archaeosortase/exosortase family protein, partial [Cyclobacteriaceae bacterium]|nr:archaeosortase/exosortase family protein [Cyclobacteriaceae bacterium]